MKTTLGIVGYFSKIKKFLFEFDHPVNRLFVNSEPNLGPKYRQLFFTIGSKICKLYKCILKSLFILIKYSHEFNGRSFIFVI